MLEINAKTIENGFKHAKDKRTVAESNWQDIFYYVFPKKRGVTYDLVEGQKMPDDVYDDTAIQSNLILAAGLSGYMTNASQRWFELRAGDVSLMNDGDVNRYLAVCSDVMYSVLGTSNFYQKIHEIYLDLGAIGFGAMYEEEDERKDIRFYSRHPKEIYIVENDKEEVDMIYRYFKMSAWQAFNFFGKDNCGKSILQAIENQDYTKEFKFIQYICPRDVRDVNKLDSSNKPIASYWYSEEDKKICKESGYDEFPYFTPRFFKNSSETYGYGAGTAAYSNVKMMNKMMEYYIKGAEIGLWPAFIAEHDGMIGTLDIRAGAMNYQKAPLQQGQQVKALEVNRDARIGIDFIERTEDKIKRAFFVDMFMALLDRRNMTATEVSERIQEKMLILGPVLGRLQEELLNPIINRTFNILLRRGKLPPPPPKLVGKSYEIVYVSPLAKAQRAIQARDMSTFLTIVQQMAQTVPDVLDNIEYDTVVNKLGRMYSIDPDIIRDSEEVIDIRNNRMKQQQMLMMLQAAEQGANISQISSKAEANSAKAEQYRNK